MMSVYHLLWVIPLTSVVTAIFTLIGVCVCAIGGEEVETDDDYTPKRLKRDA